MLPILGAAGAAKGSQTASNAASALKNDLYVRRWATVKGKGKNKKAVDHELHINPVGAAVGAAGVAVAGGLAVLGVALALRFSGKKIKSGDVTKRFLVDEFDAEYGTKTVVDTPARTVTEITYIHGTPKEVQVSYPAITHEERVLVSSGTAVLLSKRAVPLGMFESRDYAVQQATKRSYKAVDGSATLVRNTRVAATHPKTRKRVWCTRYFYEFVATGVTIEDEKDKWWNPFD